MKITFLRNLTGTEILAKDIYDSDGKPLFKAGSTINNTIIKTLKRIGVFLVYIEDSDLEDITEDKTLKKIKASSIEQLPTIFNDIISKNYESYAKIIDLVDSMVNYILSKGSINTNLFEVRTFDNYTYIHCVDTALMAIYLGLSLKFDEEKIRNLGISALLHDIGKTKVSEELINKPGSFSAEEFEIIKRHVVYGKNSLKEAGIFPSCVIDGINHHHERFDGKGYPYGLKNKSISDFGRIISICDSFTALSANRSYRDRFGPNEAYEYILSGGGTLFDMDYVNVFKKAFSIYPLGCCVKLSNGVEGYVVRQNSNFPDRPIIRVTYNHENNEKISPYEINLINNNKLIISTLVL